LEAHDFRTRTAGAITFIEFHLIVLGGIAVEVAHEICDRLETVIKQALTRCEVVIDIEPETKAKHHGIVVM
jgi:divalent metal cation (Fe/Co/Zn/Cd) transporter